MVMNRKFIFAFLVFMGFLMSKLMQNDLNKAEAEPLMRSTKTK
jgi:hypothetical protein